MSSRSGYLFLLVLLLAIFSITKMATSQSTPVTAGYRDFNFGPNSSSEPTYGKTESKLWWNDGRWWGILWNPGTNRYEIYRFDAATQSWVSTNTAADIRSGSKADVLWDGQHLYIASHIYTTTSPGPTTSAYFSKLYRYSYNSSSKLYSLNSGFPVNINSSKSETLTLDKDSTGKLWITWIENNKVMLNSAAASNEQSWGVPFALPVQGNDTDPDDISGLVALGGNKIGVMWSNQKDSTMYFAVHLDGNADTVWQAREVALSGAGLGPVADDFFSLKASHDGSGNLYAAVATLLSGSSSSSTGIFVLKRSANGIWTKHVFATVNLNHSRPLLMVNDESQRLYVLARSTDTGPGYVYMKSASLSDLVFSIGLGTPILQSSTDINITYPASTKQDVNLATGILVLAADRDSRNYLHNYIDLAGGVPKITSFTPATGATGTTVTITGSQFTNTTAISFNGTPANFTFISDTQLNVTVSAGASTGPISITNPAGIGTSTATFVVQRKLTVTSIGSGTVNLNPIGGVYNEGTVVTLTAVPPTGWKFYKWGSNLSGSNLFTTITMNADKLVTAEFRALAQYTVTLNLVGSGNVALNPPSSTGLPSGVYYDGAVVTLTATPGAGDVFSGYTSDFNGWLNVETLTMTANKNLTATFSPLPAARYANGIWTSAAEISNLPTSGLGWDNLKLGADEPIGLPNLSDNEDSVGVAVLAKALVYARTGNSTYRQAVISACMAAIGTEQSGDALAFGRELLAYVLAADLVGLPPTDDATFRNWLRSALTKDLKGQSLRSANESRPNNWGTRCGATRVAIARYLGDATELERTARVFKGWLGDRNMYADFSYDRDLSWQANPATPVGINPVGATIQGHSVDGVLPDDQRRAGPFAWPPPKENYVYGALQGALMEAIILHRAGYDVWNWQDQALLRAVKWLYEVDDYLPDGDDEWLPHIINHFYKTKFSAAPVARFPAPFPAKPGKNAGWTDWLYGSKYPLTVSDNNGDIIIHALGTVNDSLVAMELAALPGTGYVFSGWGGALNGVKNPDTLVMNAGKNVIANFVKASSFALTINVDGSGTVNLNPPGGVYVSGTVVTLTANPATGFQFAGWSSALSGANNPATLTMNTNKIVTAIFTPMSLVKQITYEETRIGVSSNSTKVKTATVLTAAAGHLYLAAISTRPRISALSVSGLGLNWTLVKSQCSGRNTTGVEVWKALGIPIKNDTVTATFASASSNAVIAVSCYSGVDEVAPLGNLISSNTKGTNAICSGGVDTGVYSFNLVTSMVGSVIYEAVAMRAKTHTPGTGYLERSEIQIGSTNTASVAVAEKSIATATTAIVNGSFSGSIDWAVVAVEMKPKLNLTLNTTGSGSVTLNSPGGTYNSGTVVTLTATPVTGFQFSGWSGDLTGSANPTIITMNSNKTVTAAFTLLPPPQYNLTINKFGTGSVVLNPPGGIYAANTKVTLIATPSEGFEFSGWSGDLSGLVNSDSITINANKTVTATFTSIPTMVVHKETRIGGASNATAVTTFGNLAGVSGHLYLAAISMRPKVAVLSVSGLGLNWTLVKSKCAGRNTTAVEVWMAQGTPTSSGVVTAFFAGTPSAAVIAVSHYSGVDIAAPIGNAFTANATGLNASAACKGGVDNSTYSFNFPATTSGAAVYGAVALKAQSHTPGAGYIERTEVLQTAGPNTSGIAVEDKTVTSPVPLGGITVTGSFDSAVDWALIALEIKPRVIAQYTLTISKTGSGSVMLNPPGGTYKQGTMVTLTAQSGPGFHFDGWSSALSGLLNPATIMIDSNKTVTANFAPNGFIVHEETQAGGSSNVTTVTTAGILTGVSKHLYLAAISTRPKTNAILVSGLGLNWILVKSKCAGRNTTGLEVWMAQGEPSRDDSVQAIWASAPTTAAITVSRYSGVDIAVPIGNIIAANTKGLNASATCAGGVDNSAYSFNLATTVNDALVYGAIALKARTHAPGAGYTERAEMQEPANNLSAGVTVQDRYVASAASVPVNGFFNDIVDWVAVALEIRPAVSLSKSGRISVNQTSVTAPVDFMLEQNYPNPFNPSTVIAYAVPHNTHMTLNVYNIRGQLVTTLVDGYQHAGRYEIRFDALHLPSGTYFSVLRAGETKLVRRIVLMK